MFGIELIWIKRFRVTFENIWLRRKCRLRTDNCGSKLLISQNFA